MEGKFGLNLQFPQPDGISPTDSQVAERLQNGPAAMAQALGPSRIFLNQFSWGVAPGWNSSGPLALQNIEAPYRQGPKARPHTRPGQHAGIVRPPYRQGPKARPHTRPGQRPGIVCPPYRQGLKARPIPPTHPKYM